MSLRVAILGAGKMGRRHLGALREIGDFPIEIVDPDQDAARSLAEPEGLLWRNDPEAALTDPRIDAVILCTPVPFHGEQTLSALKSGKHVFTEKPMCRTEERARAILRAAKESNKVVQTGFLSRYAPSFTRVKSWLEEGLLGGVHLAIFRVGGRGSHRLWKHLKAEGGGVVSEMVTHKLDMAIWLFGPLDEARTFVHENIVPEREIRGELKEVDAQDLFVAEARAGMTRILFVADFLSPSYIEYMEAHGENGSIFGSMLSRLPTTLFLNDARGGYDAGLTSFSFDEIDLVQRELEDFFQRIDSGSFSIDAATDALHMARALREFGIFT